MALYYYGDDIFHNSFIVSIQDGQHMLNTKIKSTLVADKSINLVQQNPDHIFCLFVSVKLDSNKNVIITLHYLK
ncbi:hypothetical protein DERF_001014 [Dermatophagoides farinae]|uniref:Uncharacterized protein n=1 Tax=Dermatophagoides farinae TaxID=6954 RepID=A0A922L8A1_DERFA|nr:hypothetical protein DERF_001014 [Dermatophagoides farinae]